MIHGYVTDNAREEEDLVIFGKDTFARNANLETNEWGWQIDPEGFRTMLSSLYQRYHKPIFVVENGIGIDETLNDKMTVEDDRRIAYHRAHIEQMRKAISLDGTKVIGYLAWAPIDFLSSHKEMRKRYGFVFINRTDQDLKDMKRYRKKSFYWYKSVIASNGSKL
jgi:6-phospho-beta-glucosidase